MRKFHGTGMMAASTEPVSMAAMRMEAEPMTTKVTSRSGSAPMALSDARAAAAPVPPREATATFLPFKSCPDCTRGLPIR